MPTIDQLAPATSASDTDELIASQSGVARKVTRAQLVAGLQPQIAVSTGSILGRASPGTGQVEQLTVGANLLISNGTLTASAAPFQVSALPAGHMPSGTDLIPIGQAGSNVAITFSQLMSATSSLSGVNASSMLVTPTGSTANETLADIAASALSRSGASMTGPLVLASNPSTPLQAATKQYVDSKASAALPLAGGIMTGVLTLAVDPTAALQAATKGYVDRQVATALPEIGGTLSGSLTLASDPTAPLQAATKQYVDSRSGGPGSLPLSGGTMSGLLTLAQDPAGPLDAATKRYVDSGVANALPLAGGTLTGALSVPTLNVAGNTTIAGKVQPASVGLSQTGSQTTILGSQLVLQRSGSGPADAPMLSSALTVNHSGGAPLSYSNMTLTTTVNDAVSSTGAFIDGTTSDVYAFVSNLNVNSVTGSGAGPDASQHVAITAAASKNAPAGGYPSGRVGAQMWGLWVPVTDHSNQSSAVSGATVGVEMDLNCNNLDPGNARLGYQYILAEGVPIASGGFPAEWAYGIYFSTSATSYYKYQISAGGNYSIAVLDTRNAFPGQSRVTAGLSAPSTTLVVDPIIPFTSAGIYGQPVSATNTAQILVGSHTYSLVGCMPDGAGKTSGTLTFSSPVSVADGAAGTQVLGAARTIWMGTGQQIAFDYGGNVNLFYDSSVGGMHLTSSLRLDGTLTIPGVAITAGTAQLPSYTVASLPAGQPGALAYAKDGRKPGEPAGGGSGLLVWAGKNGQWLSSLSGTPVQA